MGKDHQTGGELWCILLAHHTLDKKVGLNPDFINLRGKFSTGLALEPVSVDTNTFRRIGFLRSTDYGQYKALNSFRNEDQISSEDLCVAENFFHSSIERRVEIVQHKTLTVILIVVTAVLTEMRQADKDALEEW